MSFWISEYKCELWYRINSTDLIKFVGKSGTIDNIILAVNYFVAPSESSQFQNHISYFTGQPELWQSMDVGPGREREGGGEIGKIIHQYFLS